MGQFIQEISLKAGGHTVSIELYWKLDVSLVREKDEDSLSKFLQGLENTE